MILTSCTAAQQCTDSFILKKSTRTRYRVSDEDFHSLFTNAVVTRSSIHCLTLCTRNQTTTYFERNTRRCRCERFSVLYDAVTTGTHYVEKRNVQGKL